LLDLVAIGCRLRLFCKTGMDDHAAETRGHVPEAQDKSHHHNTAWAGVVSVTAGTPANRTPRPSAIVG
jgi:hypothetical protein